MGKFYYLFISIFLCIGNTLYAQDKFQVIQGIPHLPVGDVAAITGPAIGMLVYDSASEQPLMYTGSSWETWCTTDITAQTSENFFIVKDSFPYLPVLDQPLVNGLSQGTLYYSTADHSLMIYNGVGWVKLSELSNTSFPSSEGFVSGEDVQTFKIPVLDADPATQVQGAFYINSTNMSLRYFNGIGWMELGCYPTVITMEAMEITGTRALLGGDVLQNGGTSLLNRGVIWSTDPMPDTSYSTKTIQQPIAPGTGEYQEQVSGLVPNTQYYIRAYAQNSTGISYGEVLEFTTVIDTPAVITRDVGTITSYAAQAYGEVLNDGGDAVTERGFIWSTSAQPKNDPNRITITDTFGGLGTYSGLLDELLGSTTYYVQAYASNVAGRGYGEVIELTTLPPVVPEFDPGSIRIFDITGYDAQGEALLLTNGGAVLTEKGIAWSLDGIDWVYGSTGDAIAELIKLGLFTSELSPLTPGTIYYARGYGINEVGTGYTDITTFSTLDFATLTTGEPREVLGATAISGGDITETGNSQILFKGIIWSTDSLELSAQAGQDVVTGLPTRQKQIQEETGEGLGIFTSSLDSLQPGTTYYVRAFAQNEVGFSYGNLDSLRTLDLATITTKAPSGFFKNTGQSGGDITNDGGTPVTQRGVAWALHDNPTLLDFHTLDGNDIGSFTSTMIGLQLMKPYWVRAYAVNLAGTAYGDLRTFMVHPGAPTIITLPVTDIQSSSAVSGGDITDAGDTDAPILARGIFWSMKGDPIDDPEAVIISNELSDDGSGVGRFYSTLHSLSGDSTYYVRAYAENQFGIAYGNLEIFTALRPVPPVLNSAAIRISNVTNVSAIADVSIINNGGSPVLERGIALSTDRINYTNIPSRIQNSTDIGDYRIFLDSLTSGTTYYAKAYASNIAGTSYGSETGFNTTSLPLLTTSRASHINGNSAQSGGHITYNGDGDILFRGLVWSAYKQEMDTQTAIVGELPDEQKTKHVVNSPGLGEYESWLSGLNPGTWYYFRAYATNLEGTGYGNLDSLFTATTASILTTQPSLVTSTTVQTGGTILSDGGQYINQRGVIWGLSDNLSLADEHTSNGSGSGIFTSNLVELLGSTEYYVRAYAGNSVGIAYGDPQKFTTRAPLVPTVRTLAAINIAGTTAVARGTVLSHGGSLVTETGIVWNTTGRPEIGTDEHLIAGEGSGAFSATLTGLTPVTKYYFRAYAINEVGIAYGEDLVFSTYTYGTVFTSPVTDITATHATGGGTIISDGGTRILRSGIVWSLDHQVPVYHRYNYRTDVWQTGAGPGIGNYIHHMGNLLGNKTYYYRAYAENEVGTAYGEVLSFVTGPPVAATLSTNLSSSRPNGISGNSGVTVISNGGALVEQVGVVWSLNSGFDPTQELNNRYTLDATGSRSIPIPDVLERGTTYYVRAFVRTNTGTELITSYAPNEQTFTTFTYPVVQTEAIDGNTITSVSANGGGTISNNGGTAILNSGLIWSTEQGATLSTAIGSTQNGGGMGRFINAITDLYGSERYWVRAYASNSVGTHYGEEVSFETLPPILATLTTLVPNVTSAVSAGGGGNISSNGGSSLQTRGLVWSTVLDFDLANYPGGNVSAATGYDDQRGNFFSNMSGLIQDTQYYVKAYVKNGVGTAYGQVVSFKTPRLPTVETRAPVPPEELSSSTAITGGDITDNGGAAIYSRGVVYSLTIDFDPDTVASMRSTDGAGDGPFTTSLKDLKANTTYYVRAYARSVAGLAYGNQISFLTNPAIRPVVTTLQPTQVRGTTATSGGHVYDQGGDHIISRGIIWSLTPGIPETLNTTNKTQILGAGMGSFASAMSGLEYGKTYYVRAYATNQIAGTGYGNELSFTTWIWPSVTTHAPLVNGINVQSGGTITSNGGTGVTNQGVIWSTSNDPGTLTIGLSTKTAYDPLSANTFKSTVTKLAPITSYYIRAYAQNSMGVGYGEILPFTTPVIIPKVSTAVVTPISMSSATTGGTVLETGGAAITARGVVWSTDRNFDPDTVVLNRTSNGSGIGTFSSLIQDLQLSTTYYVRAYASNSTGTGYGNQVTVSIFPTSPRLTTMEISGIGGYSALSGGIIESDGGAAISQKGVVWGTSPGPTLRDGRSYLGSGDEDFVSGFGGLLPNTYYYVRAYAINKIGTAYGIEKRFLTNGLPVLRPTLAMTDIIATTAISGGDVTDDGRTPIRSRGIAWSVYSNPSIGLSSKTFEEIVAPNDGLGVFSAKLSGMKPDTDYYVRSYATNSVGTEYGAEVKFRTQVVTLPSVRTIQPAGIDSAMAISGGDVTDDGGMPVTLRGITWSKTPMPTITLPTKTNDAAGGLGMYSNRMVGLEPGTTYYVRAFAINSFGTAYGEQEVFTTESIRPSVGLVTVSELSLSTATGKATVLKDGGSELTDRGLTWSLSDKTPVYPSPLDSTISNGADGMDISGLLEKLEPGTRYYVWAYATNIQGTRYSARGTEFTSLTLPLLSTTKATSITRNSARSGGNITSDGGVPILGRGVVWNTDSLVLAEIGIPTQTSDGIGKGTFASQVTGLKEGFWYYVRAYATSSMGTSYGQVEKFRTMNVPTVETAEASSITSASLTSGGNVSDDGGAAVLARGVVWTTDSTQLPSVSMGTKTTNGTGMGVYTSALASLTHYTDYYVRAYATNSLGTGYGKLDTIRTAPIAPVLSNVEVENSSNTEVTIKASVSDDGGATITRQGFVWNNVGNPNIDSNSFILEVGVLEEDFTEFIENLREGPTYYVRAFATNSEGTSYSPIVSRFKKCPADFSVIHVAGLNGAPVDKTVDYHSVSSDYSGELLCWLTQNLGAQKQADSFDDRSQEAAGWYWQFNNMQGYQHDGTTLSPAPTVWKPWITGFNESSSWTQENDPCNLLLGLGWRLPSATEWTNSDGEPQNWTQASDAFQSELKIHMAGLLNYPNGGLLNRGINGYYWGSTQASNSQATYFVLGANSSSMANTYKSYGMPLRCVRDTLISSIPTVSKVEFLAKDRTKDTAIGTATVSSDGGAAISRRGFVWNTTGSPTLEDGTVMEDQAGGLGVIKALFDGLVESPTYYVRAFASNSIGTAYSQESTSFKICFDFTVIHQAGLHGAPVSKTVTYGVVSSNISGEARCWLTQNLGADQPATSVRDGSEASAGWYWQFNRSQGYAHDGVKRTPSNAWTPWNTSINENSNWSPDNDPCNLLLGGGWRMPTTLEWIAADAPPQNWTNAANAFSSELKIHAAGLLEYTSGALNYRGTNGYYWTANQQVNASQAGYFYTTNTASTTNNTVKSYGMSVRCLRDEIAFSKPSVTNVLVPEPDMQQDAAMAYATITLDGGSTILSRGFVLNTTGNPTLSDQVIPVGSGSGDIASLLKNLQEGPTYYVRAYAENALGTGYSPEVTSFKICNDFTVIHTAGLNGAPVSKTVTYGTVSTNISGQARCWITQNLGAEKQAETRLEASEEAAGWYWQFNRSQGYAYGNTRVPANAWTPWIASINENTTWKLENDPCNLLLGAGWRLPTESEWSNVDAPPQNWLNGADAYASVLKLHASGLLYYGSGVLDQRGTNGYFWSSSQHTVTEGRYLYFTNAVSTTYFTTKAYGMTARCLRDEIVLSKPSITTALAPEPEIGESSAMLYSTVTLDGGAKITARGFVWNTTGNPDVDNATKIELAGELGAVSSLLEGLREGPTYYVRGFAQNSEGISYSPEVTSFKICNEFTVLHAAGMNGAPVRKTVTYGTVSTSISGQARCWITQNLGAEKQAESVLDASEEAAGWYWQFNRSQGYAYEDARVPANASTPWTGSFNENTTWVLENDPCNLLLGAGWRLPTESEWHAADAPPQNWLGATDAFSSELKLHAAGLLHYGSGVLDQRGTNGYYWSSSQHSLTEGRYFYMLNAVSTTHFTTKAYGMSVRCLRDEIVLSIPLVDDVRIPTTDMTNNSARVFSGVMHDGGAEVTDRGFVWATNANNLTIEGATKVQTGTGIGAMSASLAGFNKEDTYYIRAYAMNSEGINYSPNVSSFRLCASFTVIHEKGLNGAASSKVVTYSTVSSDLTGTEKCWIAQNLGADQMALSPTDNSEASAGWYWQFNRPQGYAYDTQLSPSNGWQASISENLSWSAENDPCNLLLGMGWRLPTHTEWTAADAGTQTWTNAWQAYDSELNLHMAGNLSTTGVLASRGSYGYYWSSASSALTTASNLQVTGSSSGMVNHVKANAFSVRCIQDAAVSSAPSVGNVVLNPASMTGSSVSGTAVVALDGGESVTERGIVWNMTGEPTVSDHKITLGTGLGEMTGSLNNLTKGPIYYLRGYAKNKEGIQYSPKVTMYDPTCLAFSVIHEKGLHGAPSSKTITYGTVISDVTGTEKCWITQNLGADRSARSATDTQSDARGWYWKFNQAQAYQSDEAGLNPYWASSAYGPGEWQTENDPCTLVLGSGWRLPTITEWTAVHSSQQWANAANAYESDLKLHMAGYLNNTNGAMTLLGSGGYYWSSTQVNAVTGGRYGMTNVLSTSTVGSYKDHGLSLRCLRDEIVLSAPSVGAIKIDRASVTADSFTGSAIVAQDGGEPVSERGFVWNTSGDPTLSDNQLSLGSGLGEMHSRISNLPEGKMYYVRAYAKNSIGISYSPKSTLFDPNCTEFTVIHTAGLNGAPVSKTVTYGTVISSATGDDLCWITQNLGADRQASTVNDPAEQAAGWYWQFNKAQGFKNENAVLTPSGGWKPVINEASDWAKENDPCALLLGMGWRLPTMTEWRAADGVQNWTTAAQAFESDLKIHMPGYLSPTGVLTTQGGNGPYWSSTQSNATNAHFFQTLSVGNSSAMSSGVKTYGFPVRCLRDSLFVTVPLVSKVELDRTSMSPDAVSGTAVVARDGGSAVTERGIVWNTTGEPTVSDTKIILGNGLGPVEMSLENLQKGSIYYIRAYAQNSSGTGYSPNVTLFDPTCLDFSIIHAEGFNGAPVSKTVSYGTVMTSVTGEAKCWITQNLGADRQASFANEATQEAAGWYWQFNRKQGYEYETSRTPVYTWNASINENLDWQAENDPCNLLLGSSWRLPTHSEWIAVNASQGWANSADAHHGELKLHNSGYLLTTGTITGRGITGYFWSNSQQTTSTGWEMYFTTSGAATMAASSKAYAFSARCIRDEAMQSLPSVSQVSMKEGDITEDSFLGSATVTLDGGSQVSARGFVWNTTGNPTLSDTVIPLGNGLGDMSTRVENLAKGPMYYVRAFATNSTGTAYSAEFTRFDPNCTDFTVIHTQGFNGAPLSKTVTYGTIMSRVTGDPKCWITQNLGADRAASSTMDLSKEATGWFWQFNKEQGYSYDNATRNPATTWVNGTSGSTDWRAENDPCNLLLGMGWRLPTYGEWEAADAAPQNWTTVEQANSSGLKFHLPGYLLTNGAMASPGPGVYGIYWSSTQASAGNAYYFQVSSGQSLLPNSYKDHGFAIRCLRDSIFTSVPSVSSLRIDDTKTTENSVFGTATVTLDGGSAITDRGIVWNTSGTPVVTDSKLSLGAGLGTMSSVITGLEKGSIYYLRSYAQNSIGIGYSPETYIVDPNCQEFTVIHVQGIDGAPVSKTVTYGTVMTSVTGDAKCWITQNLGADRQAATVNDASQAASGWYWQFNKAQGYQAEGAIRTPNTAWIGGAAGINEHTDWSFENDPCNLLLGSGWRLPTLTEWTAADAAPQNWASATQAFNSELKLHVGGILDPSGNLLYRGQYGYYWTSSRTDATNASYLSLVNGSSILSSYKTHGMSVRCLRDEIILSMPSVSNVLFDPSSITENSVQAIGTVTLDGSSKVMDRGFVWNTSGDPTVADTKVTAGNGLGEFSQVLTNLNKGSIYYIRAYAQNSLGITYSPESIRFDPNCTDFTVIHLQGLHGAPSTKTITYGTLSTEITGRNACWITQNLGAERQASSFNDPSEAAGGWYWQFNQAQGYQVETTLRSPGVGWIGGTAGINEDEAWSFENDPCNLLLGVGWRLPTLTEWTAADAAPQNWTSPVHAYASELKLHGAGILDYPTGGLIQRGQYGYYWSGTQQSAVNGHYLRLVEGSVVNNTVKTYGMSVRCLRDEISQSIPSVGNVTMHPEQMSENLFFGTATVALDGGAEVTERGFVWNKTGNPSVSDNALMVPAAAKLGEFEGSIQGLSENDTYFVRAYAKNSLGISYSPMDTKFDPRCFGFSMEHLAGVQGSPVSKTITYGAVSTTITGEEKCWITQNLGAQKQATSAHDASEGARGWFWQFNRPQGFQYEQAMRTPVVAWNTDWVSGLYDMGNDPCQLLLGGTWRMPTNSEWIKVYGAPQNWKNANDAYHSELKLHMAGVLNYTTGVLESQGSLGSYWSSTSESTSVTFPFYMTSSTSAMNRAANSWGYPVRCLSDLIR